MSKLSGQFRSQEWPDICSVLRRRMGRGLPSRSYGLAWRSPGVECLTHVFPCQSPYFGKEACLGAVWLAQLGILWLLLRPLHHQPQPRFRTSKAPKGRIEASPENCIPSTPANPRPHLHSFRVNGSPTRQPFTMAKKRKSQQPALRSPTDPLPIRSRSAC